MSLPKIYSKDKMHKKERFWAFYWYDVEIIFFLPVNQYAFPGWGNWWNWTALHSIHFCWGWEQLAQELCSSSNLGHYKKENFTQTQAFQTSLITWNFLCCAFKPYVLNKKHTGDNFFHIFLVCLLSILFQAVALGTEAFTVTEKEGFSIPILIFKT